MKKFFLLFLLCLSSLFGLSAEATMNLGSHSIIVSVNGKLGVKAGTSNDGGNMSITVPANSIKLTFYLAAWNGESPTVVITPTANVNITSILPLSDSGISGNGNIYTLTNAESSYYYEIELNNITTDINIIFTTNSGKKRFAIWDALYIKPLKYTISFENLLGTNPNNITQTNFGSSINLPTNVEICNKCYNPEWGFEGWVTSLENYTTIYRSTFTPTKDTTLYALYSRRGTENIEIEEYKLVTSDQNNWEGEYLISYSETIFADGRIGGQNNDGSIGYANIKVNPETNLENDVIKKDWGNLYNITLEEISSGSRTYLMKTKDEKYNYFTSRDKNGIDVTSDRGTAAAHPIIINFVSSDNILLKLKDDSYNHVFQYNVQGFFRFYKNGGLSAVKLYKKQISLYESPIEYTTAPECDSIFITTWSNNKISLEPIDNILLTSIKEVNSSQIIYNYSPTLNSELEEYELTIDLHNRYCKKINIHLTGNNETYLIYKVPFIIDEDSYTEDLEDENCDVVINSTLTASDNTKNRNITIYPNGELIIPSNKSYTVNTLSLLKVEDEVPQLKLDGTLNVILNKVSIIMRLDPSVWHFFTLPAEYNMSDVKLRNGKTAEYRSDYWVKWYDGQHRADTQSGSWKHLGGDKIPWGTGHIIGVSGNGKAKKDLIFNYTTDVLDREKALYKTIDSFYAWGADKTDEELRPNHKGWHLVGNPYLCNYSVANFRAPLRVGKLIHELNELGNWTGRWISDEETVTSKLRYVVVPIDNGNSEYELVLLTDKVSLEPLTSYFVLIGNDNNDPTQNQTIVFERSNKLLAPRHTIDSYKEEELFFELKLINSKGEYDKTGFIIANKFTEKYETMDDMMKWRNSNYKLKTKPVIASLIPTCELAYNALNDSLARAGVPLNYYAHKEGNYTFSLGTLDDFGFIKEIYIYDSVELKWVNLMNEDYQFYTNATDNKSRFMILVIISRDDITTNINNIPTFGTYKFCDGEHVYINTNNNIYNVLGVKCR